MRCRWKQLNRCNWLRPVRKARQKLSDKINPPGVALVTSLIVIPIAIIMAGTVSATLMPPSHPLLGTLQLIGSPMVALMIALVLAFWLLAFTSRLELYNTSDIMGSALPTAAVVILVTGAGGVLAKCWWNRASAKPCQYATND